jgi:SAM-dependent methyltransferase
MEGFMLLRASFIFDYIRKWVRYDMVEPDLRKKIIEYWNKAGLCSFDSSTSHNDPFIASCNNFIESKLLEDLLKRKKKEIKAKVSKGIDIGAGLGRFTIILARNLEYVDALEPAKNLYYKLIHNCSNFSNVEPFNTDFESFNSKKDYNIAIVSGVLYLYPSYDIHKLFNKLLNHLENDGVIIIRDFISKNGEKKISSSYIEGNFCYYRDVHYWDSIAKSFGLELIQVFQSTPSYPFKGFRWLISRSARIFNVDFVKKVLYNNVKHKKDKGIIDFSSGIQTVFMVMRKI